MEFATYLQANHYTYFKFQKAFHDFLILLRKRSPSDSSAFKVIQTTNAFFFPSLFASNIPLILNGKSVPNEHKVFAVRKRDPIYKSAMEKEKKAEGTAETESFQSKQEQGLVLPNLPQENQGPQFFS